MSTCCQQAFAKACSHEGSQHFHLGKVALARCRTLLRSTCSIVHVRVRVQAFGTAYAEYDMPSTLILADNCTAILRQLRSSSATSVRERTLQNSRRLSIVVPNVPSVGGTPIKAFSAAGVLAVLFANEAVAQISVSADAEAVLADAERLAERLSKAGVPEDALITICNAVKLGDAPIIDRSASACFCFVCLFCINRRCRERYCCAM